MARARDISDEMVRLGWGYMRDDDKRRVPMVPRGPSPSERRPTREELRQFERLMEQLPYRGLPDPNAPPPLPPPGGIPVWSPAQPVRMVAADTPALPEMPAALDEADAPANLIGTPAPVVGRSPQSESFMRQWEAYRQWLKTAPRSGPGPDPDYRTPAILGIRG
jgi:hypothetical protein